MKVRFLSKVTPDTFGLKSKELVEFMRENQEIGLNAKENLEVLRDTGWKEVMGTPHQIDEKRNTYRIRPLKTTDITIPRQVIYTGIPAPLELRYLNSLDDSDEMYMVIQHGVFKMTASTVRHRENENVTGKYGGFKPPHFGEERVRYFTNERDARDYYYWLHTSKAAMKHKKYISLRDRIIGLDSEKEHVLDYYISAKTNEELWLYYRNNHLEIIYKEPLAETEYLEEAGVTPKRIEKVLDRAKFNLQKDRYMTERSLKKFLKKWFEECMVISYLSPGLREVVKELYLAFIDDEIKSILKWETKYTENTLHFTPARIGRDGTTLLPEFQLLNNGDVSEMFKVGERKFYTFLQCARRLALIALSR